jgi:hypothetical protein
VEDVGEVALDGLLTDAEPSGDLFVGRSVGDQDQDLPLPVGQPLFRRARGSLGQQLRSRLRIQGSLAARGGQDRLVEYRRFDILQQIADGACVERADDPISIRRM